MKARTLVAALSLVILFGQAAVAEEPVNLALHKQAYQSSRSQWSRPNDPEGAVDGVINGRFGFHTAQQQNPWWEVDLGQPSVIARIVVYNRLDCCSQRAAHLVALLSDDGHDWRQIYVHDGSVFGGSDGRPLVIHVHRQRARFVRLQLRDYQFFHLDEVQVMGWPDVPRPIAVTPIVTNVNTGPIWNNADAAGKCPAVCRDRRWNGQWWTTVPNQASVCQCVTRPAFRPVPPPPPPQPRPSGLVTVNAGPIWNNADAAQKCPAACGNHHWNGQWWTTQQNVMSVCQCVDDDDVPPPRVIPVAPMPAPVQVSCVPAGDFSSIKAAINAASFSADKLGALRTAAQGRTFCVEQVGELVDLFSFSSDQVAVVKMLAHQIVDRQNAYKLLGHFTFSSDKERVQRILQQ